MRELLWIKASCTAESNIKDVALALEMTKRADELGMVIELSFNDTTLVALPRSCSESLVEEYEKAIRSEKYPKMVFAKRVRRRHV